MSTPAYRGPGGMLPDLPVRPEGVQGPFGMEGPDIAGFNDIPATRFVSPAYRGPGGMRPDLPVRPQGVQGPFGMEGPDQSVGDIPATRFVSPAYRGPGGLNQSQGTSSSGSSNLFQGAPLPSVVTTTEKATQAPEFYTNYLQDIANLGQSAVAQGGIAGFSPLQQQAFQMAPDIAFSGAGSLGAASQLAGQAGATTVPNVVGQYMNPYTQNVVNEMARLQQRQIQESVLPSMRAAAAGTGQFGSQRQLQATGNVLRDLQADLLGKQYQALQSGYGEATKAAQTDLQRALDAAKGFTTLGQEQQELGLGGLKALSEYGAQQQALGQKMLDYPMAQAKAFSELMRGYTIPTADVTQVTGPQAGAYATSPLAQIAGLLTGLGALSGRSGVFKRGGEVRQMAKGGLPGRKSPPANAEYTDGRGNYYDGQGYLVR